jgi:hypothetical protein
MSVTGLTDISVPTSKDVFRLTAFQNWLAGARAALNELASETLERAGVQAECDGNPRIAIDLARQLIAVNPYCESVGVGEPE